MMILKEREREWQILTETRYTQKKRWIYREKERGRESAKENKAIERARDKVMCESEQTGVSDMNLGLARENRCQEFRKFMQHPFLSLSFPTKLKRNPMSKDIIKNIYLMSGIRKSCNIFLSSLYFTVNNPSPLNITRNIYHYLSNLTRTMNATYPSRKAM